MFDPAPTNPPRVNVIPHWHKMRGGRFAVDDFTGDREFWVASAATIDGTEFALRAVLIEARPERWLVRFDDGQEVWVDPRTVRKC